MTPEEIKTLKVMFATFKFDITQIIEETVTKILQKQSSDKVARRREQEW